MRRYRQCHALMERLVELYPDALPPFPSKSIVTHLSAKKLQKRIEMLRVWFKAVAKIPNILEVSGGEVGFRERSIFFFSCIFRFQNLYIFTLLLLLRPAKWTSNFPACHTLVLLQRIVVQFVEPRSKQETSCCPICNFLIVALVVPFYLLLHLRFGQHARVLSWCSLEGGGTGTKCVGWWKQSQLKRFDVLYEWCFTSKRATQSSKRGKRKSEKRSQ